MKLAAHQNKPESCPITRAPLFGVFLRWPEDGEEWIHPFDVGVARHLLPGNRVFQRDDFDSDYYLYSYGKLTFRAKPKLWMLVEHEGLKVGDSVQTKSQMGQHRPRLTTIKEIVWDPQLRRIKYLAINSDRKHSRTFLAEDLELFQPIHRRH